MRFKKNVTKKVNTINITRQFKGNKSLDCQVFIFELSSDHLIQLNKDRNYLLYLIQ